MRTKSRFLTTTSLPYCKGCGHHLVVRSTVKALDAQGRDPLDVVLVTDIGCQGIADRAFATHTVHGLHGRSVALGSGIAMGLPPQEDEERDVIVYIGDGGATIGLQHLLEAARLNLNLTVVVHNNMLYGMTGGQPSGLTPCGFRTVITQEGSPFPHHDVCKLVHEAGAAYARRLLGRSISTISEAIHEALAVEGFALVEVLELCTSYAVKMNPGLRLQELAEEAGYKPGVWREGETDRRSAFHPTPREALPSLMGKDVVEVIEVSESQDTASLEDCIALVIGGSAGEGVQKAAELFAQAGIASGLHATKKGSYPVTVGVGFSTAEVILSRDPIAYHGIDRPDAVIVTSADGLAHNQERIRGMAEGAVWLDESLEAPPTDAAVHSRDFRGRAGPRNAALYSLLTFAQETGTIAPPTLAHIIRESSIGDYIPDDMLAEFAEE
jgi:pyruvate/2-oxoacid:ferredoxin oxidoreductase beta subunit